MGHREEYRLRVWNLSWVRTLTQATFQRKSWILEGTKGNQIVLKGRGVEEEER